MANDSLTDYLRTLTAGEGYQLVTALKSSPRETTELVRDPLGNLRIRKTFSRESGLGSTYAKLKERLDAGAPVSHAPRIYECYQTESELVVIMEYLSGVTLWDRVEAEGSGLATARRYFAALCDAVQELHDAFVPTLIHRDLKPSNVLVTPEGEVRLLDFGISREMHEDASGDTAVMGTREYAPPEQFGYRQTDARSDIYSLGMILYHLLTGQTPQAALTQRGFEDPDVPEALRPVLMRATAFDPEHRYENAAALKEDFNRALAGEALLLGGHVGDVDPRRDFRWFGDTSLSSGRALGILARDLLAFCIIFFSVVVTLAGMGGVLENGISEVPAFIGSVGLALVPGLTTAYFASSRYFLYRKYPRLKNLPASRVILVGILTALLLFVVAIFFEYMTAA